MNVSATIRELDTIHSAEAATSVLHPIRRQMLARLASPNSAAGLARETGVPRQKLNYHLRDLENNALVVRVGEQRKGNCIERLYRATARSYVIAPEALGELVPDPGAVRDRFSSTYLLANAVQTVRDVSTLRARADAAGKKLPTLSLNVTVRFASPKAQAEFAQSLANAVARVVANYNDDTSPDGRSFNVTVGAYPQLKPISEEGEARRSAGDSMGETHE